MKHFEIVDQYNEWWGDFETIADAKAELANLNGYVGYIFKIIEVWFEEAGE